MKCYFNNNSEKHKYYNKYLHSQKLHNKQDLYKNNTSGYTGISKRKDGRYACYYCINSKQYRTTKTTLEQAIAWRENKEKEKIYMNGYQEALDRLKSEAHHFYEDWQLEIPDDVVYSEKLLQKLVDKEKLTHSFIAPKPTKEEVLKKFEELGYEILISPTNKNHIQIAYEENDTIIEVYCNKKPKMYWYECRRFGVNEPQVILRQEHQLLTELFIALGWLNG